VTMKLDEMGLDMQTTERRQLAGEVVEAEYMRRGMTRGKAAARMCCSYSNLGGGFYGQRRPLDSGQ